MVVIKNGGREFYVDDRLHKNIQKVKEKVNGKDEDYFFIIDGAEGSGKSVLAQQLAMVVDPTFSLDRMVFNSKDFTSAILGASKGQAVVFDEAFRGLSSRGALSEVNKLLVGLMMECRQKNLIVFVVLPSFFLLDKYVAMHRAKGLFHVYRKEGKRGFWMFFNSHKMKILYLKGKALYSYKVPKTHFVGRFYDQYTIDEVEYRKKKHEQLLNSGHVTKAEGYFDERNLLLWFLNREVGLSTPELSRRLSDFGWSVKQQTLSDAIVKKEADLKINGFLED